MISTVPHYQTFRTDLNILALGNRLVPLGADRSGLTDARAVYLPYLRFSFISDVIVRLDVEVSFDNIVWTVRPTLLGIAGQVMTPYDLPAPWNNTGFVVMAAPVVRLRLTVPGAVNTAVLHCFATLSNVGG